MKTKNSWFVVLVMSLLLASALSATLAAADEGKAKAETVSVMKLRMKMLGEGFNDFVFNVKKFFAFENSAKMELLEERNEEMKLRQKEWFEFKSSALAQFNISGESGNMSAEDKKALIELIQAKHKTLIKSHLELTSEMQELRVREKIKGDVEIRLVDKTEAEAKIVGDRALVEVERKFFTNTTDKEAIVEEIISEFALDEGKADALLEVKENPQQNLEEKFEVEVKVVNGIAQVEVELKFVLNETSREKILDAIVEKTKLTEEQVTEAMEFEVVNAEAEREAREEDKTEIEIKVKNGETRVETEINGTETKLRLNTTERAEVVAEVAAATGLSVSDVEKLVPMADAEGELREGTEVKIESEGGELEIEAESHGGSGRGGSNSGRR